MGGDGFWGDPGASGSGGVEKRSRAMNKEGTKEPMSQAPFFILQLNFPQTDVKIREKRRI